ncbi:MAG TPA: hypothetical protein VND64_04355 [Pirellulales bacterium]|nr:hypothetical protein [Pirellulales bacterium]
MRSDLQNVAGITDIETDIGARLCKFKLKDENLDLAGKLSELAETNSHMSGWSLVE